MTAEGRRGQSTVTAGFEDRGDYKVKNTGASRHWERQGRDSPLEPPKRASTPKPPKPSF